MNGSSLFVHNVTLSTKFAAFRPWRNSPTSLRISTGHPVFDQTGIQGN
jgi:hypothetical protein